MSNLASIINGQNRFSRKWGTRNSIAEPYITGYHFINWTYIPIACVNGFKHMGNFENAFILNDRRQVANTLASLCLSVTIPGRTVNPVEMQGLGGLKWRAVGNIDEGNDLSMRFLELQELPIHRIFHSWTKGIRDNRSGTTFLQGNASDGRYAKSNYAGTVYYWTTQPNGYDVQFASCYAGVFPLKDPSDSFSHDVASNDKLEIDIDFSTDYSYQEEWVYKRCQEFMVPNQSRGAWSVQVDTGTMANGGSILEYSNGIDR